jgi:hypothetical protein
MSVVVERLRRFAVLEDETLILPVEKESQSEEEFHHCESRMDWQSRARALGSRTHDFNP